ncbi:hypothetical protein CEXT_346301 [Caerostris extrusa]|uniref:Uncharacterized protein n=1 Tax=Caerostris extrusa TaxID=172846 RepID=A0AAV4Q370_CAEEX|nr:hypothetical protein CEXT_346301 [Caerostris extrusa]
MINYPYFVGKSRSEDMVSIETTINLPVTQRLKSQSTFLNADAIYGLNLSIIYKQPLTDSYKVNHLKAAEMNSFFYIIKFLLMDPPITLWEMLVSLANSFNSKT